MFYQDEGKIEFAVGNRDMILAGMKAEIFLILFLTSGFAVLICLWTFGAAKFKQYIKHVLCKHYDSLLL